jgi:hypothetical protein
MQGAAFPPRPKGRSIHAEYLMNHLYVGIGAAVYVLFVVWCIVTPQK